MVVRWRIGNAAKCIASHRVTFKLIQFKTWILFQKPASFTASSCSEKLEDGRQTDHSRHRQCSILQMLPGTYPVDTVNQGNWSLSIKWRLEDFGIVAKCTQYDNVLTNSLATPKYIQLLTGSIKILQSSFNVTLFFKHFDRLKFYGIHSKCLKNCAV